jgi:hypothetical protein
MDSGVVHPTGIGDEFSKSVLASRCNQVLLQLSVRHLGRPDPKHTIRNSHLIGPTSPYHDRCECASHNPRTSGSARGVAHALIAVRATTADSRKAVRRSNLPNSPGTKRRSISSPRVGALARMLNSQQLMLTIQHASSVVKALHVQRPLARNSGGVQLSIQTQPTRARFLFASAAMTGEIANVNS